MRSNHNKLLPLSLAAIGIVYGDIGTSPLYAFRETLTGMPITQENIFGVLSLIFWSLILVISIKYLVYVLRADNNGEGGVLALLALLKKHDVKAYNFFLTTAIIGTALLVGDGMITPAISVMSAIEGLQVTLPAFSYLALPLTFAILLILFLSQHFGTARIGNYFGPIILIWFITIAILGGFQIIEHPIILQAINPYYALQFFGNNGWNGYLLLGSVFLVVTGGESLYADLGQFGKTPIRISWFAVILPSLLLNYFGQGAYLLNEPEAIINPFYSIAPSWFAYPLLLLATAATIIASQSVITATFSLTKQAVLLDLIPKVPIIQTSKDERGQVYVPQMNFILALGTLLLVITFKNSSALAHAYGIAVNLVMLIVTILIIFVSRIVWRWSITKILCIFSMLLLIDLAFLGSNMHKIFSGGWVPILFAMLCSIIMITWYKGVQILRSTFYGGQGSLKDVVDIIKTSNINVTPNTCVIFIADPYDESANTLLRYLKLIHFKPELALIVSINVKNSPYISKNERYEFIKLGSNIQQLILHNGFMQLINIPDALSKCNFMGLLPSYIDLNEALYLIESTNIIPTQNKSTLYFFWQEKIFAFLMRNSALDIEFFHLPYDRTITIGSYFEI